MRHVMIIPSVLVLLASCTSTPVAITYAGHSLIGAGSSSEDHSTFSFKVTDDAVACSGSYSLSLAFVPKFTFPISCSDGRMGHVHAYRGDKAMDRAGVDFPVQGKIIFSDGAVGMFNLGSYARDLNYKSMIYKDFLEKMDEKTYK